MNSHVSRISMIAMCALLFSTGCALWERDASLPNYQEDEYATYAAQKSGTLEALDELGITPSRKLTDDEKEALVKRIRLKKLERGMVSERERDQYFNFKAYLESDDERIAFLSLPTTEARDRYAMQRGIYFKTNKFAPPVRDAVSHSDIILGMTKDAVIESWGEPESVEVAGNQLYGNEKWKYVEYVSTSEGYQREERIVFFEAGKVAGWQKY